MPHYLATCGGMAHSAGELTAVLANLALVMASWRALCLNRGDLEGEGVAVDRGVSRRTRGRRKRSVRDAVAGVAASRPRVPNCAGVVAAVRGVAQQGRGWPHRVDSDGVVLPPA
jgi:hypothetical protein